MSDLYHFAVKRFEELIENEQESLGAGSAKDYGAYMKQVGVISGLTRAINEFKEIHRNAMGYDLDQDDEEDGL